MPAHPGLLTLFVHSGADEYVPASLDPAQLSRRFVSAADADGCARALVIDGANHGLSSPDGAAATFVHAVGELLDESMERIFTTAEDF